MLALALCRTPTLISCGLCFLGLSMPPRSTYTVRPLPFGALRRRHSISRSTRVAVSASDMGSQHGTRMVETMDGQTARTILMFLCKDKDTCKTVVKFAKRLRRRTTANANSVICVQCSKVFYDEKNKATTCRYHPGTRLASFDRHPSSCIANPSRRAGTLDPAYDSDYRADYDEECHGAIDTPKMREECPEGFEWDCCNNDGLSPGCVRGWHVGDPSM